MITFESVILVYIMLNGCVKKYGKFDCNLLTGLNLINLKYVGVQKFLKKFYLKLVCKIFCSPFFFVSFDICVILLSCMLCYSLKFYCT